MAAGQDWGHDVMVPTVRDIKTLGANWIATHPYGSISTDGSVGRRRFDGAVPGHWTRPIEEAHALGLKVCIKPHLAYWGSGFSWRGDIAFDSEEEWARFWGDYSDWILRLAAACSEADAFVIGTELDKTLHDEARWRALIASVRKVYDGPITYAANWSDYKRVPFWDALDVIGIQGYFPITKEETPTAADIEAGWQRVIDELRDYSLAQGRNVVFTELGYNQSYITAAEPWNYRSDDEGARAVQELCWQTALEAIATEPRIVGALLWKWFPHPRPIGPQLPARDPTDHAHHRQCLAGRGAGHRVQPGGFRTLAAKAPRQAAAETGLMAESLRGISESPVRESRPRSVRDIAGVTVDVDDHRSMGRPLRAEA